jgi:HlyD family secretion protein
MRLPLPARWLYLLFAATLVGLVAWGLWPRAQPVETAVIGFQPLAVSFVEEGRTRVRHRFVLSAPVDGELQRIEREPGDAVVAGEALARLYPVRAALLDAATKADAQARLQAAEAERAAAAAALDAAVADASQARLRARRLDKLAVAQQVSKEQHEQARTEQQAAQARVRSAQALLQAAGSRRDAIRDALALQGSDRRGPTWLALLAPADGRILQRFVESAGPVRAGQPLLELGDPRDLEAVVDVLTTEALRLQPGTPVTLRIAPDRAPLAGRLRHVEPAAFTKVSALGVEEQRVRAIVDLPGPVPALGDGYRVDAEFRVWAAPRVLSVPVAALFRDGESWAVYVVDQGRARRRRVQVGHLGTAGAEVAAGLSPGTEVILYPGDDVRDGQRVEPR